MPRSKKNETKKLVDAAKSILSNDFDIDGTIEINEIDNKPKYKIVKGAIIVQYDGTIAKTNGILDSTGTVIAVAISRPGKPQFYSASNNTQSKVLMYGDLELYSYDSKNNKIGFCIMNNKRWTISQIKDKDGTLRKPYITTPWSMISKNNNNDRKNMIEPPEFSQEIKKLCDVAINLAAEECKTRIEKNEITSAQETYSTSIHAAEELAKLMVNKSANNIRSNTIKSNNNQNYNISDSASELFK